MPKGSKPGERRGGRQKGTPNKMTADLRQAITEAFQRAGGVDYLLGVAEKNAAVFCQLIGKVIPAQIEMSINEDLADRVKRAKERSGQK